MFYNFSFETQANFDEQEFSDYHPAKDNSLPTTTHNSPGSVKSGSSISFDLENSADNSFEQGTQVNHAQSIWISSLDMLAHSMQFGIDQDQGFNNQELYRSVNVSQMNEEKTLEDVIKGNRLLRCKERNKFMEELQKQTEICGMLVQLMVIFNQKVFNELIYVIQNIWERKYLPYRESKVTKKPSIIPQFKCFFGFDDDEKEGENEMYDDTNNSAQVREASEKEIEELARELFISKRLKYLNFQEIRGEKSSKSILQNNFLTFIKMISKSVFLSAEGIYEEQIEVPTFSEQDQEECELFELEGNRFVRAFSQIQEDQESECYAPEVSKRRKLF